MPRKPAPGTGMEGLSTSGPGPADGAVGGIVPTDQAPSSFQENESNLEAERQAAGKRADEAAKRLLGLDSGKAPAFDPKDPRHKPKAAASAPGDEDDTEHPTPDSGEGEELEDEPEATAQPDATHSDADEEDTSAGDDAGDNDPEYEAALKALRYDFGDDASILIQGRSREELISLGKRAKQRQRELSLRLQEQSERAKSQQATETSPEPAETAQAVQPTKAWQERISNLADHLGLDDEATGELAAVIQGAASELVAPVLKTARDNDAAVAYLVESRMQERLAREVPGLEDDATWKKVVNKAQILLRSPGSGYTVESAFDDAADLVTRGGLSSARRGSETKSSRRRTSSQPTNPSRRSTEAHKPTKMSEDERQFAIFERLYRGDEEGAKKFARPGQ